MEEQSPKKINYKDLARSIRISFIWYLIILGSWWMMGVYTEMFFSLKVQMIIIGLSSLISFLQTKK